MTHAHACSFLVTQRIFFIVNYFCAILQSKNHIKNVKWDVKRLQQQVASNEEELKELKVHVKELKQNVERLAIAG